MSKYKDVVELCVDIGMGIGALDAIDGSVVEVIKNYKCTDKYGEELREIRKKILDVQESLKKDFILEAEIMKENDSK